MTNILRAEKRAENVDKNKPIVTKTVTKIERCNGCRQKSTLKLKITANAGMIVRANVRTVCEAKVDSAPLGSKRKEQCGHNILFMIQEKMPDK